VHNDLWGPGNPAGPRGRLTRISAFRGCSPRLWLRPARSNPPCRESSSRQSSHSSDGMGARMPHRSSTCHSSFDEGISLRVGGSTRKRCRKGCGPGSRRQGLTASCRRSPCRTCRPKKRLDAASVTSPLDPKLTFAKGSGAPRNLGSALDTQNVQKRPMSHR